MGTRSQWKRALRLVPQQSGETAIATFLAFATTEELWVITPPMARVLPEKLKEDYGWICSPHGLDVSYDRVPDLIRPMLDVLLRRWSLTQPTHVRELLQLWRGFLIRRRWILPQLAVMKARGVSDEELSLLFDRLCADYERGQCVP